MIKNFFKRIPLLSSVLIEISSYIHSARFKRKFRAVSSALSDSGRFTCRWEECYPCQGDATSTTGFDAHYVFHTAWAARILSKKIPDVHVDISSDLRFVTLVSAFVPIDFYDYRPTYFSLSGLTSKQGNVTALPFEDNSISSLSCMHVVEHIGLERYGDPFDPQGDVKAMHELHRVLQPGGQLLFVVPVGGEARIQYNAHRIYSFEMICAAFKDLHLEEFALITDKGEFIENATQRQADMQRYGCGCWLFKKSKLARG